MNRSDRILMALCPLAASMTLACGGAEDLDAEPLDLGAEAKPRVHSVQLTRLEITSDDAPTMLHPIDVELELDVNGEAFSADVQVGLTADDGELGCVLGAFPVGQDEAGTTHFTLSNELFVRGDCVGLIDRDDVELYAAFDPWGELDVERSGTVVDEPSGIYDLSRGSILETEECGECRVATRLHDSPGVDAQLREVGLSSSVAVLSLPASPDQVEMPADETPHFSISSAARVLGLARGQTPADGETFMTYRLRPRAGAAGTEGLGARELDWAPLLERREDEGGVEYRDRVPLEMRGQTAYQQASAVYIGDDLAARMGAGDWQGIEEFELQTCVSGDYGQAIYSGEHAPRDNDCAVLPVVVVREYVAADGSRGIESSDQLAGGGKARSAMAWGTGWQTTNNFAGTTYTNGVNFETWLDLNSSDSATTTYGGRAVNGAGAWFEAGAKSVAIVFNNDITLLEAYVTAIGLDNDPTGSGIEAKVEAMGQSFFDTGGFVSANDGLTLTLEQILSMAGKSTNTLWDQSWLLYGYSFDDGCSTVEAGIFLKGEIGLDNQATQLNINAVPSGVQLSGTIAPTAALLAESRAEAGYSGFLSINVALEMAIDIIRITLPFTASATMTMGSPNTLALEQSASLELSSLAGSITFSFDYEFGCVNWPWPIGRQCSSGNHSHTLASWSGISHTWPLFSLDQSFDFGPGITPDSDSFCDQYDGETIKLRTHHDKYVLATNVLGNWVVGQSPEVGSWSQFAVECQANDQVALRRGTRYLKAKNANGNYDIDVQTFIGDWERFTPIQQNDGTWAFETHHGRYLQALSGGGMNQQTFVGTWEKFIVQN